MLQSTLRGALCALAFASGPALALPSTVPQGERNSWAVRELPTDFVGPGSVHSLGTSIVFQTPSAVYLWSAITLRWAVVPVSATAQVTQFNAYVIVEDGNTVHGFATRRGNVRTLQLPAAPTLHHGSITSCWISVAQLDDEVWAFGAFDGEWRHQDLASPTPTVSIAQTVAVVDDGVELHGFSTYHDGPVSTPVVAGGTLQTSGDVAVQWSPTEVAAFSAHTNTWAVEPLAAGVALTVQRGYAMFQDGADWVAYSPCTGDFERITPPAGANFTAGRYVAAGDAGNEVLAYSSGQNGFASHTFQSAPVIEIDDEVLAVQDTDGVRAFSVVTGTFSDLLPGAFSLLLGDAMIWADDGLEGHAYASVPGTWTQAPAFDQQTQVLMLRNAVVLADAQGYHAFSGRNGAWSSITTATAQNYTAPTSGDVCAAFDGDQVHLYDPVLARWATLDGPSPVVDHDVWRQTFVGHDGTRAVGFGLMNNRWDTLPLQGTVQQLDANSSCGHVVTDTHLFTYSAHGSLSTLSRFPEFSRLQPLGAPLHLILVAPPGSTVRTFFSTGPGHQPFAPLGTILVDRQAIFRVVPMGPVPAAGLLDQGLQLPDQPGLQGAALHLQALVTTPAGATYLTNAIAPVIL